MFRKILAAVDGSAPSLEAARVAAHLAATQGAPLTVLHVLQPPVVPEPFPGAPGLDPQAVARYLEAVREAVRERVEPAVRAEGARCVFVSEIGEPVATILRVAEAQGFDLIVLGSRGWGSEQSARLGSISHGVAHRAHCPVLVVPSAVLLSREA